MEISFRSLIDRLDWSNRETVFSILNKHKFSNLLGTEIQALLSREQRRSSNPKEPDIRVGMAVK